MAEEHEEIFNGFGESKWGEGVHDIQVYISNYPEENYWYAYTDGGGMRDDWETTREGILRDIRDEYGDVLFYSLSDYKRDIGIPLEDALSEG